MTRIQGLLVSFVAIAGIGACNKPTEEDCKKAIVNMSTLMGTDKQADGDLQGEIRRCKGGSKKDAVDCAIKATSIDQLHACGFTLKPPPKKPDQK